MMGCVQMTAERKSKKQRSGKKRSSPVQHLSGDPDAKPHVDHADQHQQDLGDPGSDPEQFEKQSIKNVGAGQGEVIVIAVDDLSLKPSRGVIQVDPLITHSQTRSCGKDEYLEIQESNAGQQSEHNEPSLGLI